MIYRHISINKGNAVIAELILTVFLTQRTSNMKRVPLQIIWSNGNPVVTLPGTRQNSGEMEKGFIAFEQQHVKTNEKPRGVLRRPKLKHVRR